MSENNETSPSRYASTPGRDMTSEVYELVSSDNVSFFVHKDILISQSMPFRQAATGPWQEASKRKILLDDWDADTIARLVEFLYSNDYPYPDPDPLEHRPAPGGPGAPASAPGPAPAPLPLPRPLTPLDECLKQWMSPSRPDKVADLQRLGPWDPARFDYESVLLLHARVYVLANYKAVQHLQTLALKRLLLVLQRLQPLQMDSHIAGNVAEFASYVYANTVLLSGSQDPLRKLTSHFIALNVVAFQKEARAVKLMAEGGDLVTDVMAKVCIRIADPKDTCPECSSPRKRYISGIRVVSGHASYYPSIVREINGDGNINAGGDTYTHSIRLVPEYTEIAGDACTSFASSMKEDAKHRPSLELRAVKDKSQGSKVIDVCLIRSRSDCGPDFEVLKRYDGMTENISYNNSAVVYLLWKTVNTED